MKSVLVLMAEIEARLACEGLGYTEQQIQDFIDMHIEGELRRDAEKAKELASAKRNADLTKAIINIALHPFRKTDEVFPSYSTKKSSYYKSDEPHIVSRGFDAEDQRDADTYQDKRNRGET